MSHIIDLTGISFSTIYQICRLRTSVTTILSTAMEHDNKENDNGG